MIDGRPGLGLRRFGRTAALLSALLAPVATAACGGGSPKARAAAKPEDRTPELVIFVYDRSTSIRDSQLELARQLTDRRLESLHFGDRIAALQLLQRSLAEPPKRWSQRVPKREYPGKNVASDSVARVRFVHDAQAYLSSYSDTANRQHIDGTDILSTLHDVSEELRAYPNTKAILYLFSDMLQSNGDIDMEGLRRMPPKGWIDRAASDGRLPDLRGLCVVVVGARVDTESGQRVKDFWDDYFRKTGAELLDSNYGLRPVRLPEEPCAGP